MKRRKIVTIVGARPQFIKAAVVSRALRHTRTLCEVMVHTGQHFDTEMSEIFFRQLDIPDPTYQLHVHGGLHGDMTGRMLTALEPIIADEKPDWVVVYGDTNSTLAGALVAAKLNIPIAHVEAGLRSYNRRMPEEVNRVVADHLSTLHFCPTQAAVTNLANEGICAGVHHVGDVMYDATLFSVEQVRRTPWIRGKLGLQEGHYAVATLHRAENTDDPVRFKQVMEFLVDRARETDVVFPLHPRTRHAAQRMQVSLSGLKIIDPIGYMEMTELLTGARAVYTDSGGLQKEAYFHRVPCVTLRNETEWVETIEHGWNRLWCEPSYKPRREISEYGQGNAGQAIAELLQSYSA